MDKNNYVVIMAGGIGSRFWPYSRTKFPKQFHDILGTGKSMLEQTAHRFYSICLLQNIYVVTNKIYKSLVQEALPFLKEEQILLEPETKNTAPCIAYACYKISSQNPDANIIVTPSDQHVLKENQFIEVILKGLETTLHNDFLLTIGIRPTRPDTGYGYIQYFPGTEVVKKVKAFREKPDLATAVSFLESGDFVWNSGLFIWNARAIQKAFATFLPDIHTIFVSGASSYYSENEEGFLTTAYAKCQRISIDYGVMEQADNVYVILGDYGWSDVGTWKSVYDISEKNSEGNVADGNILLYNTKNCIIKTPSEKLVVINGLEGFIVAEYDGVLMICKKEDEQRVKEFVGAAKDKFQDKYI